MAGAEASKDDIKLITKLLPSFKMPKVSVMDTMATITLGEGPYSGVRFTIAKLAQHDSIQSLYHEWTNGRGGLPSLKSVLEHYPSFYLPVTEKGQAWKKAINERKLLCSLIETRGVATMQTELERCAAVKGGRWENLVKAMRAERRGVATEADDDDAGEAA